MKRVVVLVTLAATLGGACERSSRTDAIATSAAPAGIVPVGKAAPSQKAAAASATLVHPLFWSVEKAGNTTYFLGTMHAGVDAARQLPAIVWNRLDAARAFAMEADLDDPATGAAIAETTGSLRDALGAEYWARLESAIGIGPARALEHAPPMVPAAALSMRGLPAMPAMDRVLSERARRAHKPVVFLEAAAHQLELLARWMDLKALRMMLDELPRGEQHARAMLDAYVTGDEGKILALSADERTDALRHGYTAAEYDREVKELLHDRNASWIAAIEQLHADGGGFVAVGALHLIGPRSVLELLAGKGYRVTRITP